MYINRYTPVDADVDMKCCVEVNLEHKCSCISILYIDVGACIIKWGAINSVYSLTDGVYFDMFV